MTWTSVKRAIGRVIDFIDVFQEPEMSKPAQAIDTVEFWHRDPESPSPWWFSPQHRSNGRVCYFFDNRNDLDYPDVRPILAILAQKFDAQIKSFFSPYNSPFEIVVNGVTIHMVNDNMPCPHISVDECDRHFLEDLIMVLKRELDATNFDT
jgi:hypothetical protein